MNGPARSIALPNRTRTPAEQGAHLEGLLGSVRTVGEVWRINARLADLDKAIAEAARARTLEPVPHVRERRGRRLDPIELARLRAEHRVVL